MSMATETEKAYLAGILDGEGCLSMTWRGKNHTHLACTVQVQMTNPEAVMLLKKLYGGNLKCRPSYQGFKPVWFWSAGNAICEVILRELLPYLTIKRAKIEAILEARALTGKKRGPGFQRYGFGRPIPVEEVEKRKLVYAKFKGNALVG